jgi:hypothetical protein
MKENKTYGDLLANYPLRKIKRGMEKPRFKKCSNNAVKIRRR